MTPTLTPEQCRRLRSLFLEGWDTHALSKQFGIPEPVVVAAIARARQEARQTQADMQQEIAR